MSVVEWLWLWHRGIAACHPERRVQVWKISRHDERKKRKQREVAQTRLQSVA